MSDNMTPHAYLSNDVPINNGLPGPSQQLPSVSHILSGRIYNDYPPLERPPSQEGLSIFHRPQHGRGNPGAFTQALPGPYGHYSHPHSNPAPYGNRSDIPLPSPFSLPSPNSDYNLHRRSIPSPLSRADGPASSGSESTLDQPRVARVVREEDIPGRGICYIYDDGTQCPKAVDGDSVNPQWGVTKAGRPRKRLAQACATCREKKIRCDPGSSVSKCSQCLRFNRECRFEQVQLSRSSQRSRSSSTGNSPAFEARSNVSPTAHRGSAATTEQSFPTAPSSKTSTEIENATSASPFLNQTTNGAYPEHPHPPKRMKSSLPSPDLDPRRAKQPEERSKIPLSEEVEVEVVVVGGMPADLSPMWDQDPFEFDERMTEYYLDRYFSNVNCTTYCMFPRGPFMRWVQQCRNKTSWEKSLLYAMLAKGTVFASTPRRHADGKTFARIAHHAMGESAGVFNLPIVQTRLILSLYDFSQGNPSKAWDLAGAAVRAACGMKLNVEEGVVDVKGGQMLDYGLDKATLIECRRRTFWSAYITDRFNGLCSGHLVMIHNEDCLLRLPCNEQMYEQGNIPLAPFFDQRKTDAEPFGTRDANASGMMAYLVQIASIWGDVLARAYRSRCQPASAWGAAYEEFYEQTVERLEAWQHSLGPRLEFSEGIIDEASQSGHLGTYGAMHVIYHCTMMKLNRHGRHDCMPPQHVDRNVKSAYEHACKTLDLLKAIAKRNRGGKSGKFGFAISSPFTGFAVLSAMDILTASGSMADLLNPGSRSIELLAGGIDVVTELSEHWSSAKTQLKLIERRFEDLMATVQCHEAPAQTRVTAFFARDPLEEPFGLEHDLVYALPKQRYLQALGWGSLIQEGDEMLEVLKRGSRVTTIPMSSNTI